ncbi:MAG: hypothetical protein KF716_18760 [Anaerolineae bacterium]|nr:hypothetical protein [Anaerolineae bacterium]
MTDVFLMGTIDAKPGQPAGWREPIKQACSRRGLACFDPTVEKWTPADAEREAHALTSAKLIVMAITSASESVGTLAESGWAFLNALTRRQTFALFVDTTFVTKELPATADAQKSNTASRRARELVHEHAERFTKSYKMPDVYIANTLSELTIWVVNRIERMKPE